MADDEAAKKSGAKGCGLAVLAVLAVVAIAVVALVWWVRDDSATEARSTELCHRAVRLRLEAQGVAGPEPTFSNESVTVPEKDRFVVTGSVRSPARSTFTCTVRRDSKGSKLRMVNLDLTPG